MQASVGLVLRYLCTCELGGTIRLNLPPVSGIGFRRLMYTNEVLRTLPREYRNLTFIAQPDHRE